MKTAYCIITDINYLPRSLVLYDSLKNYSQESSCHFFCLDEETQKALAQFGIDDKFIIPRRHFLARYEAELAGRHQNEISWTCKPIALEYLIQNVTDIDFVAYIDSDMLFFSDPDIAFQWSQDDDYILTAHNFTLPFFAKFEPIAGHYNAGFIAFKKSEAGIKTLLWWKEQCLRSCPNTPRAGIYSDQKYLDSFHSISGKEIRQNHPGLNIAPWNIDGIHVSKRKQQIFVNDFPLILYHFQGFKIIAKHLFDYYSDRYRIPDIAVKYIYTPYADLLHAKISEFYEMNIPIATYKIGWKQMLRKASDICLQRANLRLAGFLRR